MIAKARLAISTGLALAAPRAALACPVCFGNSDSPMAIATNLGIFAMLIVGLIFCGVIAVGQLVERVGERRRERKRLLRPY